MFCCVKRQRGSGLDNHEGNCRVGQVRSVFFFCFESFVWKSLSASVSLSLCFCLFDSVVCVCVCVCMCVRACTGMRAYMCVWCARVAVSCVRVNAFACLSSLSLSPPPFSFCYIFPSLIKILGTQHDQPKAPIKSRSSSSWIPPPCSRSGELRTQKLKSHLVRTQSLNVLLLKPGVGQCIAIHATFTARDFFLAYFYPSSPFTCIFPKPLIFVCVGCG